ncbi:THUMP domain-containing protein [Bacteriovorax sp. PP10]|uniref:THUMP domain-containing protein n=1 Tax=Bacteriovorax antarcticus TaxID=3088717 RepID=A0ABU5VQ82_9BACT|nr:THUMP domain-containing protein [Bacteriovorax sp. PP10]MEA9355209.1 THUMP domain-containing protein [Bacteriovorax sp. PP10]
MSKFPPKKDGFKKDYRKERLDREKREPKKHSDVKDTPRPKVNAEGVKEFDQATFFASCPREVEHLLEKEIRDLGITRIEVEKGGVAFKAEIEQALDVLLQSRVASRVFKELQVYTIASEKDLYARAKEKWWDKVFTVNQTFKINTLFDRETKENFSNSIIFSQLLKDAIADNFREKFGERPSVDTGRPDITFLLRVERKQGTDLYNARILVDMCGEPISNRGYREESLKAPLRENLAAAIILTTDFDPEKDIFTDSMCGTGTLLIEAILMKAKVAPTYLKIRQFIEKKVPVFDFIKHPWFTVDRKAVRIFEEKAMAIYNHSLAALNELQSRQFFGFDITERAMETTRIHLHNAMIDQQIVTLNKRDATKITPMDDPPGIVICNPPYGERMGEEEELKQLYKDYGENLKHNFKGFRAYVFTSNPMLRKCISLGTASRHTFYNGSLECRLLKYELY